MDAVADVFDDVILVVVFVLSSVPPFPTPSVTEKA